MSRRLDIHMLGGLMLEYDGRVLPPIATRIGRSLFAFLVGRRDTQPTRDLVAGTFWPEMTETQARRRLSQTLWQIQNSLSEHTGGETYIISDANTVYFNQAAPYWLDVAEFDEVLRNLKVGPEPAPDVEFARVEAAVELYRGDFLAGFYDDWIGLEQERLREQLYAGLRYLVRMSKARGDFEGALLHARRLALHDPLNEGSHREVMRLLLLLGRANEALRQYEHARSVIADELGTNPSPATDELRDQIAEQRRLVRRPFSLDAQSRLFGSSELPLVGRERERGQLVAAMEGVLARRGVTSLIEGSAGAGKTRLARALADDAQWRGLSVLWGAATEADPVRTYEPFIQLLDDGLTPLRVERLTDQLPAWARDAVARLLPRLEHWVSEKGQSPVAAETMHEAVFETIAAMCEMNPTLLVIDDLQWADRDSLEVLSLLSERVNSRSLMIVILYRGDEARERADVWQLLERLDRSGAERLPVGELTAADTRQLIRRIAPESITGDLVEKLHSDTAGNPLFILETLRALHELDRSAALDETSLDLVSLELPVSSTVADLVSSRIARLPARERTILEILAALGAPADADLVQVAAGISRHELLEGLEELGRRGFTEVAGNRYTAGHDIQRRAAYGSIEESRRIDLHSSLARALSEVGSDDVAALAHHHFLAGDLAQAGSYFLEAGRRARRVLALHTAAQHYRSAVDLLQDGADKRTSLFELESVLDLLGRRDEQKMVLARLGDSEHIGDKTFQANLARRRALFLANTGQLEQAIGVARDAFELELEAGTIAGQQEALAIVARAMVWSGKPKDAIPILDQYKRTSSEPTAAEARVRLSLGSAFSQSGDYQAARVQTEEAVQLARGSGDQLTEAEAMSALAVVLAAGGDMAASIDIYERVIDACEEAGYRYLTAVAKGNLASTLYYQGRIGLSLKNAREALAISRFIANDRVAALVQGNLAATTARFVGNFDEATMHASSALDYFTAIGHDDAAAQALGVIGIVSLAQGDMDTAAESVGRAIDELATEDGWTRASLLGHRANLRLAEGKPGEAFDWAEAGLKICRKLRLGRLELDLASVAAEALIEMADCATAVEMLSQTRNEHGDTPSAYLAPLIQGLALQAIDRASEGAELIELAHALSRQVLDSLEPADRAFTSNIESYARVEAAMAAVMGTVIEAELPSATAPIGRPLQPEDLVTVLWTVEMPGDKDVGPSKTIRHHRLQRLLSEAAKQGAEPTVADLADALSVSVSTIRRDLADLRQQGLPASTRGSR